MKLHTTLRRGGAAAAVLALSLSFAACSDEDSSADDNNTGDETSAPAEGGEDTPAESGDDQFANVFGPACDMLPAEGEPGSLDGMVMDPVGTAASTNPLLTEGLVPAVQAVPGLLDTLNDESATYTVFAPANDAFAAIDPEALQGLVEGAAEPDSPLSQVLTHHVLAERIEPADLIDTTQTPLFGGDLEISGTTEDGVTITDGDITANVLCGGIPTANATVYVIDTVLASPLG